MQVRLGYVAMSVHLKNASPSQTMSYTRFSAMENREAAIRRLERIAESNVRNCLRLLRYNQAHHISFFRLSSRLFPLATHDQLHDWDYMSPLRPALRELGNYATEMNMRIDFHPDHFVMVNTPKEDVFRNAVRTLAYHHKLLRGMGIDHVHRCVLHVGGVYGDRVKALEQFLEGWSRLPSALQQMIMLENDDKSFHLQDTLYLAEKLNIPLVFDYHHHLAHHRDPNWEADWQRVVNTWAHSPLPIKMHISSPKDDRQFRSHADYIDVNMFLTFLKKINGSVPMIDCMIEAKQKDQALFVLLDQLAKHPDVQIADVEQQAQRDGNPHTPNVHFELMH